MATRLLDIIECSVLSEMAKELSSVVAYTFRDQKELTGDLRKRLKKAIRGVVKGKGVFRKELNKFLVDVLLQHIDASINNTFWCEKRPVDKEVIAGFQAAVVRAMYASLDGWDCRYDPDAKKNRWWHPLWGYDGTCRCRASTIEQ